MWGVITRFISISLQDENEIDWTRCGHAWHSLSLFATYTSSESCGNGPLEKHRNIRKRYNAFKWNKKEPLVPKVLLGLSCRLKSDFWAHTLESRHEHDDTDTIALLKFMPVCKDLWCGRKIDLVASTGCSRLKWTSVALPTRKVNFWDFSVVITKSETQSIWTILRHPHRLYFNYERMRSFKCE